MKKRMLSLICVLALCLGLLPATTLAAGEDAPAKLYVGDQQVIEAETVTYWSTNDSGGLTRVTNATDASKDWTVRYNPNTATLTLNEAKISGSYNEYNNPFTAGIYAKGSSDQPVALTIELIGTNTITGAYGIFLDAETNTSSYGTNATLTITGESNGSLKVSGSSSYGIYVKSGTGNASLTIENASVDATSSVSHSNYYAGVCVGSSDSATAPDLSLTVNGGSLTTSASESNDGIQFYVGASEATSATTSLTVSDNAIVRAENGIKAYHVDEPTPSGTGIVFDGTEGTVYGSVELQENLTIGEGESLTIPGGASLNTAGKLTVDGGTLTQNGTVTGGVTYKVTGVSLSPDTLTLDVGESSTLTATITPDNATDKSVTWESSASGVATVDTSGKVTAVSVGTATITATAADGSGEKATCSVTVNAAAIVPVESVSLHKTSLELTEGGTARLTATILPDIATNKNVTWSTSDASIATVTDGVVTAVAPGTATITVTTEDGGKTATCAVTVAAATVPVTGVTLNKTSTSLYVGDTETLTATVAPDNATNKAVTWTSSDSTVATVDQNGVVTALARGTAVITATAADGSGANATCTVTVSRYSSGGGSSSSSTSLSDRAIDDIQDARPGDTVEITLRPGRTTLEREVFEELAGQDITLEIDAGDGVLWTVNGLDIPEDTRLHDLDLDVDLGDSDIPATVLNAVTGEISTVQLSLAHDGEFGFTMTLSAPLGRDNADYWANLYWYNERTEELEFQQAARIANDGTAEFALDHASDYAIVIDDRSHEPVDLPFNDVPEGYWAYDAIQYVYGEGLMAGTSGSTFSPEGTTTRGQIVTILWRLSGSPVVNYLMDFDDVDPAAYYAEAIRWASAEGVAGGYGGGVFGPDDPITREQLAVMLHRYAQHEGYDVSIGEDTNILSYADAFDVSEYAVAALQWACGAGIISGTGDGSTLTPQGEATRAQAATVLMRFCNMYGNP